MEERVRQMLVEIVNEYGSEVLFDQRRINGLLKDMCGDCKREINVLTLAVQEKIPTELHKHSGSVVEKHLFIRLVHRMMDSFAMKEEHANWAVESLILGLGKYIDGQKNLPSKKLMPPNLTLYDKGPELMKGQRVEVFCESDLNPLLFEVGWRGSPQIPQEHIDASAFLLTKADKVSDDSDFIFYSNRISSNGALQLTDEEYTDDKDVTFRRFRIEASKLPSYVEKIAFTLTIYDEIDKTFMEIPEVLIRALDIRNKKLTFSFSVGNFSVETAIVLGQLYRYKEGWRFNAIGSGYKGGLKSLCEDFGLEIAD